MPDPNGEDYWKTHATSAPGFHRQELDDPAPEPPQATAVEPSKRALTLREAERMVRGQREKDYGTPEQNMGVIAALWTTYVGKTIMPHDVAAMMALLKIARIRSTSTQDSWVDLAGYAAIGSEVAL